MRDFLVEGLSPLPHSGGNKSNVFQQVLLEMCMDDPWEYDDWKSTTERTLSVPWTLSMQCVFTFSP